MPNTLTISLPGQPHTYQVFIGAGLIAEASRLLKLESYSKVFVVTDVHMERLLLSKLMAALPEGTKHITLQPGEEGKTIRQVERIWSALRDAGCDRHSIALLLGGGVVGDLGAFAASTYMRGMAFVHIPTTLLSQVDSSIGGKTGFDYEGLKNLIGSFAEPTAVLSDSNVLTTLPHRELVSGFGEMFKHGLIKDARYYRALMEKRPEEYTTDELEKFIAISVKIKAGVVESDEVEKGARKLVNFGHTVGHAIEALSWSSEHSLLHGEAVAIGMVVEADLSRQREFITEAEVEELRRALLYAGLPTKMPAYPIEKIMANMHADKKDEGDAIMFDLLRHIGEAVYDQTLDEQVVVDTIKDNMESVHAE